MIQKNSIAMNIVLTILTCGIWGLVWIYQITSDTNKITNDYSTSGVVVLLLSFLTCGIYMIYWHYKTSKSIYDYMVENKIKTDDRSIACLVLSIIKLDIVSLFLIQDQLNVISENNTNSSVNVNNANSNVSESNANSNVSENK